MKTLEEQSEDYCDVGQIIVDKDEFRYKIWQPQIGEWCWFYTTADDDRPRDYHLVKHVGYQNGRYCFVVDGRVIYKQLKDIEPFIGILPTSLKDK
jgi:hypothetical protein